MDKNFDALHRLNAVCKTIRMWCDEHDLGTIPITVLHHSKWNKHVGTGLKDIWGLNVVDSDTMEEDEIFVYVDRYFSAFPLYASLPKRFRWYKEDKRGVSVSGRSTMINLTDEMLTAVLCYVDDCWAWFTTCTLSDQWGDDWNDAPYEHNAGDPYAWKPYMAERQVPLSDYRLFRLAWDGPYETPAQKANSNSHYSVEDINAGAIAWLSRSWYRDTHVLPIYAGITLHEFIDRMRAASGQVFVDLSDLHDERDKGFT